jgi:hypothetical protein
LLEKQCKTKIAVIFSSINLSILIPLSWPLFTTYIRIGFEFSSEELIFELNFKYYDEIATNTMNPELAHRVEIYFKGTLLIF